MQALFEIATKVATPLSLSGLVIMVLFLLYRQIIAGPLAVQLSKSQAFHTLNRLIGFVFALAVLATILGVASLLLVHFFPPAKREADVRPVGINIVEPPKPTSPAVSDTSNLNNPPAAPLKKVARLLPQKPELPDSKEYPKVEVMVRNSGDQIAVLKSAIFHVSNIFVFGNIGHPAVLENSWTYDVMLPVDKKPPYDVRIPISQTVPPDGADRFTFRLGNNASPYGDSMGGGPKTYVFQVKIQLEYNETGKTVSFDDFLVASSPAGRVVAKFVADDDDIEYDENGNRTTMAAMNAEKALRLSKVKAIRSNWVNAILADYLKN